MVRVVDRFRRPDNEWAMGNRNKQIITKIKLNSIYIVNKEFLIIHNIQ